MGLKLVEPGRVVPSELDERALDPVEIVEHHPGPITAVREAWVYRRVARTVFWSVLVQTIIRFRLGPTWLILQTFMSLIGYSLIFGGGIFNVKAPNGMPYFLFVMVGMMGWLLFEQTLMMSTRGFQRVKLLKHIHLPLVWVPIVGSAQSLIRWALYMTGYFIAITYLWASRGQRYLQLSPRLIAMSFGGLLLCLMFAWGLGMWTAPLYAWARDVRYALRYVIKFWIFVTPVLYPIEHLRGTTRTLAELNPLSSPVEMVKVGFLGAGAVPFRAAIFSIALIVGIFVSGIWFISRYGHSLAAVGANDPYGMDDDDDDDSL